VVSETELIHRIANVLEKEGLKFIVEPLVGGLRPDFVVEGPDGRIAVLEVKTWLPGRANTERASRQVQLYKEATGADFAFLVMNRVKQDDPERGVVSLPSLIPAIRKVFAQRPRRRASRRSETVSRSKKKLMFAAMPFDSKYDDVYFVGIVKAAEALQAEAARVDQEPFSSALREPNHAIIKVVFADGTVWSIETTTYSQYTGWQFDVTTISS
jgi:hypothetical protein